MLKDALQRPAIQPDNRGDWVVAVTAQSRSALRANAKDLVDHIEINTYTRVPDPSYTTSTRRVQRNYRIAVRCNTLDKVTGQFKVKAETPIEPIPGVSPRIAFAYTGQGSHYTALAKQLYELSQHFRSNIDTFNNLTCSQDFPPFLSLVVGDVEAQSLSSVVIRVGLACIQMDLTRLWACIQMGLTRLWASWGIKPEIVVAHSLGESAGTKCS